jgi:hypothetical protein
MQIGGSLDKQMEEDPFINIVKGRVPLSENAGAAKQWTLDGVPRPDCSLSTMQWLSLFLGGLGFDHFYARSPMTGFAKLLTGGGFGVWWLWDVLQLWLEPTRVVAYGLSAPFDMQFASGIAQGMITDKPTVYKTNAPYSPWFIGIMLSFMGIDALLAKQIGQFLRKFTESLILFGCCIGIWRTVMGGITVGAIVGLFFLCLIAMMFAAIVVDEYVNVLSVVFSGSLFTSGLTFTQKADAQYNGMFKGIIKSIAAIMLSPQRKEDIITDLQYGGMPPSELLKMFKIQHTTEYAAQQSEESVKEPVERPSAIFSFILLLISPIMLIATWIWHGIGLFYPPARYMEMMAEMGVIDVGSITKAVKTGAVPGNKSAVKGFLSGIATGVPEALDTYNPINDERAKALRETYVKADTINQAVRDPSVFTVNNPIKNPLHKIQRGGALPESLSTESQIFGAVTVALMSGGIIKGLVDYLVAE